MAPTTLLETARQCERLGVSTSEGASQAPLDALLPMDSADSSVSAALLPGAAGVAGAPAGARPAAAAPPPAADACSPRPRRGSIDVSGMFSVEGTARHMSELISPSTLGSAGLPSGATDVAAYLGSPRHPLPQQLQEQQQQQQQRQQQQQQQNGAAPSPEQQQERQQTSGVHASGLPLVSSPVDAAAYFSLEGATREQGTLRSLAGQFAGVPGVVSLSGGFPPPSLFPFAGLTVHLAGGGSVSVGDMHAAQQYNFSLRGYAPLLAWAEAHVAALHAPPPAVGHQVLITNGGNHTLEMVFALFCDRGDAILLEEYSYPVVTESLAQPKGLHAVPVPIDAQGIIPERLAAVLAAARAAADAPGGPRFPKLLYTVPTGQNPTGCTITPKRRGAVYRLCQQYGLLIVEDDPYCYLRYGAGPDAVPGLGGLGRCGSYLGLDVDGRVMRVDSFAKFLAPGLRLGWVTASAQIIDKLTMTIQSHTVGPCSLSQAITAEVLCHWGEAGLDAHLRRVQREYAQRAACITAAAHKHLAGLAEWAPPTAGMFLWLRLLTVQDASDIWDELRAAQVVLLPGRAMHCRSKDPAFHSPYLRVSFSNASPADLEEGMRRLGGVLRARAAAAGGSAMVA